MIPSKDEAGDGWNGAEVRQSPLDLCKALLDRGEQFGDTYLNLTTQADQEAIKAYFCYNPNLPLHRTPPVTTISVPAYTTTTRSQAEATGSFTGNACTRCYGVRMVRNGTCELCLDCGETSGCS